MVVWNARTLLQSTDDSQPSAEETLAIVDELYTEWVPGTYSDIANIHIWACQRFDTTLEEINRDTLDRNVGVRIEQLKRLYGLVKKYPELRDDGLVQEKVGRIAKVIREARNSLQACAILFYQMDDARQLSLPDGWNPDSFFQHIANDEKTTTFQRLLFVVLEKLAADGLRRLNDECWEPIFATGTNEFTHAWRRLMTIRQYIYEKVQKESDYEEWKCLTNPHDNGDRVVEHLIKSSQVEFPKITMNRFLWAYNNGLYNVRDDMFWPFAMCRISSVDLVTPELVRQLMEPQALDPNDEVPREDQATLLANGVFVWRVQENGRLTPESFFKIGSQYYLNCYGREDWTLLGTRIQAFRRGLHFCNLKELSAAAVRHLPAPECDDCSALRTSLGDPHAVVDGVSVWNVCEGGELTRASYLECENGILRKNDNGREVWTRPNGEKYTVEQPGTNDVAVRHFDIDFRFSITPEEEAHFDPEAIELPAMGKIMSAQELTPDTQKWLLVMLCRLFFPLGYDRWQVILFIRGIAGSGKSTIAQLVRHFYPPTCVTTLSSNIEQKFGLSAIYHGLLCICSEVREDFKLDQGDWQAAVSGEEVQIATKGKTAFSHKWETPFLWLGNEMPNYRNASGSFDRRVFMVEFGKRVVESDPHLLDRFKEDVDMYQRKGIALYHASLRKYGQRDIWSEGVVGAQLTKWRTDVKMESDPVFAFMTSGLLVYEPEFYMPFKDFQDLYQEYRRSVGFEKMGLKKYQYEKNFQDMQISTARKKKEWPLGSGTTVDTQFCIGCTKAPDADMM